MAIRGRMRILKTLLGIRFGPGAAILPTSIKRINLAFAYNWNGGHLGPRRFWRTCLPRLKYHNPLVAMSVERTTDQTSKPVMTIYSEDGSERTIDMRMKMEGEIWGELIGTTGASLVVPSVEEEEELKVVVEERVKSEGDRIRNEKEKAKRAEDKRLLEQARQAVS